MPENRLPKARPMCIPWNKGWLVGHVKVDSTVRWRGVWLDVAKGTAEKIELRRTGAWPHPSYTFQDRPFADRPACDGSAP